MWLIAHKVRGEPALDVATRIDCPCGSGCDECGGYGYWWVLSTGGQRAYPVVWWGFEEIVTVQGDWPATALEDLDFSGVPDLFEAALTSKVRIANVDISTLLNLKPKTIPEGFKRRI